MKIYKIFIIILILFMWEITFAGLQGALESQSVETVKDSTGVNQIQETFKESQKHLNWFSSFKLFEAIILFLLAYLIIKYLTELLAIFAERYANLRLTIKKLIPLIRIFGWSFVIYIIVVRVFNPPMETLIAFFASAGVAIGFASQDILKNIFGGVMIIFDRPFQVGDKIEVGDYYGEVQQIGLRTVRIVTPDDSEVSIPNSVIMNQFVANANSGASNCQVVAEFYLPAYINVPIVKKIAYRAAATSRYVFLNKPIVVRFRNEIYEGRSMLKMRLKAYVLDVRYEFPFHSEMTETVIKELLAHELITPGELSSCPNSTLST